MANNYKYIGHNYTTPDLVAKVTGKARYAEDYRAEGMLFVKLLLSPMPHARVSTSTPAAALALPGVKAILRASDFPAPPPPPTPPGQPAAAAAAAAARDRAHRRTGLPGRADSGHRRRRRGTAAEAIELINVTYEPLPFVRRSARQPAAGRRQRPHPGQRLHRRRPRR